MQPIPAIHSLLSPVHLEDFVFERYLLPARPVCRLLKSGMNQTYLVKCGDATYILRIYTHQWRPKAEIEAEIALLLRLHGAGLPVSVPIAGTAGAYLHELLAPEGIREAVLFSFAPGQKLRALSPDQCTQFGEQMARMHQLTLDQSIRRITYSHETLLELPYRYATGYFSESLPDMAFIRKAVTTLKPLLAEARMAACRRGVVHLDLWYDNMNIAAGTDITFFDFDFCGNGWLVLDVAYSLAQLFHTEPDKSVYEIRKAHFLAGYESLLLLSDAERALIPWLGMAIWIFYLGVQSQTYHTYSNVFFSDNYLARFMGMAKSWLEYHQIEL